MTASTNVPYRVVALRVGCVFSQVIAASGDLSWKLSLTPEYKFTNNGLSLPICTDSKNAESLRVETNIGGRQCVLGLFIDTLNTPVRVLLMMLVLLYTI